MRERGLRVLEADDTSFTIHAACTDRLDAITSAETVFVTLKAHSLPGLAPALASAAGKQSTFVFAQNGVPWWFFLGTDDASLESVDPGGVIASSFPAERVLGCVVYPATTLLEPGVVRHVEGNRFSVGELDGAQTERIRTLSSALVQAGLKAPVQTRLRQEIWLKLIGNATLNPVSALTRATLAELVQGASTRELLRCLMLEVEAVGRARGRAPDVDVAGRRVGPAARGRGAGGLGGGAGGAGGRPHAGAGPRLHPHPAAGPVPAAFLSCVRSSRRLPSTCTLVIVRTSTDCFDP